MPLAFPDSLHVTLLAMGGAAYRAPMLGPTARWMTARPATNARAAPMSWRLAGSVVLAPSPLPWSTWCA
eukprot:3560216-Alexandrium_andersonii.AAC.1